MPPIKPPRGFSFFGLVGGGGDPNSNTPHVVPPSLKLQADKDVYRAGDPVGITIEIRNPSNSCSLLVEKLAFEIKGIEKLDTQWFSTPKSSPQSNQRRGEYVFMDYSTPAIVSNQILSSGAIKLYVVRTILPSIIPPSYRGSTIRYMYYVRSTLLGQYLKLENGQFCEESIQKLPEVEARVPLQIWVTQENNGLFAEQGRNYGIVPTTTITLDAYWKDMDGDSDWARSNEIYDGVEEGYDSSRDEISSVFSYNLSKENIHKPFGSSLSLQSFAGRSSTKDLADPEEQNGVSSYVAQHRLVADMSYDSAGDVLSPQKSSSIVSPNQHINHIESLPVGDESESPSVSEAVEPTASEGFARGRSYNIKLDDEVLLRFSPKNSDSTYYFSDVIGGTLTFFHEEGARRCLELSITLEMSETINRRFVHPSRRQAPTIIKVQSDYQEVVADLVQTSFLFSIPMDGPMSFSTHNVSVQWALRFEFFTTLKNVDLTRFEHPLLIEGRDRCEWVLPITVHAPPFGSQVTHNRKEKPFSLDPLWVHT